jgi:uncharacterized small protein (DUF1192 family)
MSFEELETRNPSGSPLSLLVKEDLDLFSVTDLDERISALEAEIARTKAAIETKGSKRSAADALFKF